MVSAKDPFLMPGTVNNPIETWINRITENRSPAEKRLIKEACELAYDVHRHQKRVSGEPYFRHPLTVTDILSDLGMDSEVLIAAILHDASDASIKTGLTMTQLKRQFGITVANLVHGVSQMRFIEKINENSDIDAKDLEKQVECLRKMLLAMAEDVRVILIKLADRLDNMRDLRYESNMERRLKFAQETLDIYAPLANRLGIWQIKWELEDLSLRYLEPDSYKQLAQLLDEKRLAREEYIRKIIQELESELKAVNVRAEISGRPKHIYSIWRKMQRKDLTFDQVFDVRAIRVLVSSVEDCYKVLGIVHGRWKPIPHEFDDYIAAPKNNNYRSLHTAVYGPDNKIFEVQIRTYLMHHDAELGIAAHWRYKEEHTKQDNYFDQRIGWLRKLLKSKEEDTDFDDLLDSFKSEISEDHVYVLSPKGKIVDLPQGATPLDFAYYIHTELGHCCRGAKVNNRIVPLNYVLKSGEQVEILTTQEAKPSRDWLNLDLKYLRTSRGRSKVRQWLTKQDFQQHVENGRHQLEKELHRLNIRDLNLEQLAHQLQIQSAEQLLGNLGRGDLSLSRITRIIHEKIFPQQRPISKAVVNEPVKFHNLKDMHILGVGGLLTQLAGCCRPVPYEPIVGYVTKARGVVVHRRDCPNALRWQNEDNERLIEVKWQQSLNQKNVLYTTEIQILAFDRPQLLVDISSVISQENINILATNTRTNKSDNKVTMEFTLEVNHLEQLSRALLKIDNLSNVMEVYRKIN